MTPAEIELSLYGHQMEAIVFLFGDYPSKDFSLTGAEFEAANPKDTLIPMDLENCWSGSMLKGNLGEATKFRVVGDELRATLGIPTHLFGTVAALNPGFARAFDRESKRITGLNWTMHPEIKGTRMLWSR